MSNSERDQHVCPNGHEIAVLIEVPCHCGARVAYEPCSIGMALHRDLQQLEGAVSPARHTITDAELDAAGKAWLDALDMDDSREAMRATLVAFLRQRGAVQAPPPDER